MENQRRPSQFGGCSAPGCSGVAMHSERESFLRARVADPLLWPILTTLSLFGKLPRCYSAFLSTVWFVTFARDLLKPRGFCCPRAKRANRVSIRPTSNYLAVLTPTEACQRVCHSSHPVNRRATYSTDARIRFANRCYRKFDRSEILSLR